jgi:DNA-binding NarL/FixJ family response regulator
MTVRVLVADDHPVFREGLRAVLAGAEGIEVAGEATTGEEAVELVAAGGCDVVLMDVQMPGLTGIEATRRIADRAAVVVLTMSEDHATLTAAMASGAVGYLVKGAAPEAVVDAVRAAARGESVFGAAVADLVRAQLARGGAPAFPQLTERERDVLRLLGAGLTNQAIADRLVLSPKSVRNLVSAVLLKLGVPDRHAAAGQARRAGLR